MGSKEARIAPPWRVTGELFRAGSDFDVFESQSDSWGFQRSPRKTPGRANQRGAGAPPELREPLETQTLPESVPYTWCRNVETTAPDEKTISEQAAHPVVESRCQNFNLFTPADRSSTEESSISSVPRCCGGCARSSRPRAEPSTGVVDGLHGRSARRQRVWRTLTSRASRGFGSQAVFGVRRGRYLSLKSHIFLIIYVPGSLSHLLSLLTRSRRLNTGKRQARRRHLTSRRAHQTR